MSREPLIKGKEPLVKKMWYGVSKIAESQSPEAWGNRVIKVIDKKIIPKLSLEQQLWAREHHEDIETAANAVGAGITTAEIVGAVALGVKMVDIAKYRMELARVRRSVQWVRTYPDLPKMPVAFAPQGADALSFQTRERIDRMYFQDGQQTTEVLRSVRKKWKELNPTLGDHKWLTEQLNGTIATLFDMTEEPEMKMLMHSFLPATNDGALSPEFERMFARAHEEAAKRFHWPYVMPHDSRAVYSFWSKRFDRVGLPELRDRVGRIERSLSRLPDPQIGEMVKHIDISPLPLARYFDDDQFFRDAVRSRTYIDNPQAARWVKLRSIQQTIRELRRPPVSHPMVSLEQIDRELEADGARYRQMLKDAISFLPEATWKNPRIAAKLERATNVLHVPKTQDVETLGILLDKAWEMRRLPDIQTMIREIDRAREAGDTRDMRRYATMLLEHAYVQKPQFEQFMGMGDSYYTRHDRLREVARIWVEDLRGIGLENMFAFREKTPGLLTRIRNAVFQK